ncbi:MAG: MutS-related protein [Bacteroidia bacterium]
MNSIFVYHSEKVRHYREEIKSQTGASSRIFYSRSALFIATVILFILFIKDTPLVAFGIVTVTVILFLVLLSREIRLRRKIAFLNNLIRIHDTELKILVKDFKGLNEGNEFLDKQHHFISDLDIFGKRSVFQLLNRTSTYSGKTKLAQWLSFPFLDTTVIKQRQEAVKELSSDKDWSYEFIATGSGNQEKSEDKEIIRSWLEEAAEFSSPYFKIVTVVVPLATIAALICYLAGIINSTPFGTLFVLQLSITGGQTKKISRIHDRLSRRFDSIEKYRRLIAFIEERKFNSATINQQKEQLKAGKLSAGDCIRELKKLTDLLDARMNLIIAVVMNGLLLWDLNLMRRIEAWKTKYKKDFGQWTAVTGEIDAYVSLGMYAANNPSYIYPEVETTEFIIEAKNMGHPMIDEEKLVKNDYVIKGKPKVDLLTGANMAGKSTFLRTVGVNLTLAMIGVPVCAEKYRFRPITLFTSLRTNDSLQENESFFYAELKRLHLLTSDYEQGKEIFFLLDEILKGTNSKDQHSGSVALIKKIIRLNGVGIIATHDVELSKLINEYPDNIRNLCFDIQIKDNKLDFSYKLTEGVCSTMNASFLMKQMGIVD